MLSCSTLPHMFHWCLHVDADKSDKAEKAAKKEKKAAKKAKKEAEKAAKSGGAPKSDSKRDEPAEAD